MAEGTPTTQSQLQGVDIFYEILSAIDSMDLTTFQDMDSYMDHDWAVENGGPLSMLGIDLMSFLENAPYADSDLEGTDELPEALHRDLQGTCPTASMPSLSLAPMTSSTPTSRAMEIPGEARVNATVPTSPPRPARSRTPRGDDIQRESASCSTGKTPRTSWNGEPSKYWSGISRYTYGKFGGEGWTGCWAGQRCKGNVIRAYREGCAEGQRGCKGYYARVNSKGDTQDFGKGTSKGKGRGQQARQNQGEQGIGKYIRKK